MRDLLFASCASPVVYDFCIHMHDNLLQKGRELFNSGRFFEAHEVWEDLWRETVGLERSWIQALVQVAAALHHASRNNHTGALSLLEKAAIRLTYCPGDFQGLAIANFRQAIAGWIEELRTNRRLSRIALNSAN